MAVVGCATGSERNAAACQANANAIKQRAIKNKVTIGSDESSNSPLKAWVRALEMTAPIARNTSVTFPVLIETLADRFGTAPALLSDQECLTYRALAEKAGQYARWALEQGLAAGDVVCLLMPNCPEYMAIWLGITRVGGIVSLLNTNLTGDSLAHSINLVAPKHVIVGADLVDTFAPVSSRLARDVKSWTYGQGNHGLQRIDHEILRSTYTRQARPAGPRLPKSAIFD
jgi:fatty-acyl-CoA synthase